VDNAAVVIATVVKLIKLTAFYPFPTLQFRIFTTNRKADADTFIARGSNYLGPFGAGNIDFPAIEAAYHFGLSAHWRAHRPVWL
jgi:hypothetical protein